MAARHQYVLLGVHATDHLFLHCNAGRRRAGGTYVYEYPGILLFLAGLIDRDGRPDSDCASVRRGPDQGGLSERVPRAGHRGCLRCRQCLPSVCVWEALLGLFTDDKTIIAIGASLLGMNLILQPGKMLNMALGNSLNAVGDTRFTMYISLGSMWLVATVLSYVLGIHMGWGLIGIYSCMIADEYLRGCCPSSAGAGKTPAEGRASRAGESSGDVNGAGAGASVMMGYDMKKDTSAVGHRGILLPY